MSKSKPVPQPPIPPITQCPPRLPEKPEVEVPARKRNSYLHQSENGTKSEGTVTNGLGPPSLAGSVNTIVAELKARGNPGVKRPVRNALENKGISSLSKQQSMNGRVSQKSAIKPLHALINSQLSEDLLKRYPIQQSSEDSTHSPNEVPKYRKAMPTKPLPQVGGYRKNLASCIEVSQSPAVNRQNISPFEQMLARNGPPITPQRRTPPQSIPPKPPRAALAPPPRTKSVSFGSNICMMVAFDEEVIAFSNRFQWNENIPPPEPYQNLTKVYQSNKVTGKSPQAPPHAPPHAPPPPAHSAQPLLVPPSVPPAPRRPSAPAPPSRVPPPPPPPPSVPPPSAYPPIPQR